MNRETLQQSRNLVRASNEVLAAAGIIESHEGYKARDAAKKKELDAREEDIQKAYRRRAYGQIALTCGVWGACGLRRRIEVKSLAFERPNSVLTNTVVPRLLRAPTHVPHPPRALNLILAAHVLRRPPSTHAKPRWVTHRHSTPS